MWWLDINVSEDCAFSNFRVEVKMEAARSSETLISNQRTARDVHP
jgi:hypothetical protein